jgi:hypothetical protein
MYLYYLQDKCPFTILPTWLLIFVWAAERPAILFPISLNTGFQKLAKSGVLFLYTCSLVLNGVKFEKGDRQNSSIVQSMLFPFLKYLFGIWA